MNAQMIARWNTAVSVDDTVYHLGDFAFAHKNKIEEILSQLNGHKHLILGNHDDQNAMTALNRWDSIQHYKEVYVNGTLIVLCHFGMRVWHKSHHNALMLYGHSHGSLPGNSRSLDVGVDCWDFTPVTLEQIQARMATLPEYTTQDHHIVRQSISPSD